MRVLVVEDARALAGAVARRLRRDGLAVDVSYDGTDALERAEMTDFDVIILDRDLPKVHGDDVCRTLAGGHARILMLTAAAEVGDRVEGLALGADDYLSKPFDVSELLARVHALARRPGRASAPVITFYDLTFDRTRHAVTRGDEPINLTAKEFAVLEALLDDPGAVISAEALLERVWDANADPFTNTVRVTVANLRRKLGEPQLIRTTIGVGYSVSPP